MHRISNKHQILKLKRHPGSAFVAVLSIVLLCAASYAFLAQNAATAYATAASQTETTLSQSASIEQPQQYDAQFSIDVVYAYVGPRTGYFTTGNPFHDKIPIDTLNAKSLYPSLVCFDITGNFKADTEPYDAKVEVYQVQISSDTGLLENYAYFVATNCQPSFKDTNALEPAVSQINSLLDGQKIDRLTGNFAYNITIDNHRLVGRVGSVGMYNSAPSELSLWKNGDPKAITMSISRVALITIKGTETTVIKAPSALSEDTVQLQLQKFGEGFIYNNLMSPDQLSKIDPFQPPT